MSNLKAKLAQKIESKADTTVNVNSIIAEDQTKEDNNLILLKSSELDNEFSYVPDFQITLNEARERIELLQNFVKEMMIPLKLITVLYLIVISQRYSKQGQKSFVIYLDFLNS